MPTPLSTRRRGVGIALWFLTGLAGIGIGALFFGYLKPLIFDHFGANGDLDFIIALTITYLILFGCVAVISSSAKRDIYQI